VARKAIALTVVWLATLAPGAGAQTMDAANGIATVADGLDTITYEVNAISGPSGENASGLIVRTFASLDGTSVIVADVTCLAVAGNRAAVIGRVQNPAGFEGLLVQIDDRTAQGLLDGVADAAGPTFNGMPTFDRCDAFLPPFPFDTRTVTAGDFQVVDAAAPPPDDCDEDDDDDDDDDDHHDDDDDEDCDDEDY
jgi:hypothetical protein